MKVLYITGACLYNNTSANMSHNAYVQGLLENGCEVDIVMADNSWGEPDKGLPKWEKATYYTFPASSFSDKIRSKFTYANKKEVSQSGSDAAVDAQPAAQESASLKSKIRNLVKKVYYSLQKDSPYPLYDYWLKKASKFKSDKVYDLVISNSSPEASHKLAIILKQNGNIKFKRLAQIWEDPWYLDIYCAFEGDKELNEERRLLESADEIYYVSPLTLEYQKRFFKTAADKMDYLPLPYFELKEQKEYDKNDIAFGYFGDYYSETRNLIPFYNAVKEEGIKTYIYGDSNLNLRSTESVTVHGRVTLDILNDVQDRSAVLVHLSNLKGGQIPGKIYHYSATNKAILFINDGTEEERKILKEIFEKYNRYYFCENNEESIKQAIKAIKEDISNGKQYKPVASFEPKNVIKNIL